MTRYSPEEQRQRTLHAIHASGLDVQSVWVRYFSLTGNVDEFEVDAYLNGLIILTPADRDLVSHAVNELISETRPPTAPYSDDPDLDDAEVLAALNALTSLYHRKDQGDRDTRNGLDDRGDRRNREDHRGDDLGENGRGRGR
ncbi:hypothetical protein ACX80U_11755 [Arthrobacter sp. TmT3-37]